MKSLLNLDLTEEEYERALFYVIETLNYSNIKLFNSSNLSIGSDIEWKFLYEFLKTSDNSFVKLAKSPFYGLFGGGNNYYERILPDFAHEYLFSHEDIIEYIPISNNSRFKISKLNNEYYLSNRELKYGSVYRISVISTYSGIFNLLEQAQNHFLLKFLTKLNDKKQEMIRRQKQRAKKKLLNDIQS